MRASTRVDHAHHVGRFSFPSNIPRNGLSTCLPVFCGRFGLLLLSACSASKLSSSKDRLPTPSHFSSSRLGSIWPRSIRKGDSAMGGRRARGDLDAAVRGGVLPPRLDRDVEEEIPAESESNLDTK